MFYDYECQKCGVVTTVNVCMKDMKRKIDCPLCGAEAIKVISAPALIGVSSSVARINKEQKRKNVEAGKKQYGSHVSAKTKK